MTDETPATTNPHTPAWWIAAAVALAIGHLAWLLAHFAPATMSPDANGYIVQARLIATEGRTSFAAESPAQFVGMHWLETREGVFHSRYPAGLPLLMAAAWKIGGLTAALLVNPVLASATVFLVFCLARGLAGNACALLAALVVALTPVANQHALDADAHIAATFFLVAGVLALRRFVSGPGVPPVGKSRASKGIGFFAGLLLGVVPTVRYPEAIVGIAIAAWLVWRVRPIAAVWPAVAGAAVPLGLLLAHNAAAYGAFWKTGYALTNEQTGFGPGYFAEHAIPYLASLSGQGLALFFAFGTAGIAALAADRRWRSDGVLFAGIVVPLVLLYMAYYFGGGPGGGGAAAIGGNMRFLIPTFPFFAVGGAWLLSRMARDLGTAGRVAVGVVAVLQALITAASSQQMLTRIKGSLTAAARVRATAEKQVPAGSVLILDRSLAESIDAGSGWRLVEEGVIGGIGGRRGPGGPGPGMGGGRGFGGDPDRPSPQQAGKNHAQQERYAGLSAGERRARAWSDVTAWAAGRPVYWFTRSLDTLEAGLPAGADYETVAEIDAPAMGFGPMGGGPMGPGGFGPGRAGRGERGGPPGFGPPGGRGFQGENPAGAGKLRLVKIAFGKT